MLLRSLLYREGTLTQTVTGIPEGEYILSVYSKAQSGQNVTGQAMLEVQRQSTVLSAGTDYAMFYQELIDNVL